MSNLILVNNSNLDLRAFDAELAECVRNGSPAPDDLAEFITLEILVGYNADGSNRGVVERAA